MCPFIQKVSNNQHELQKSLEKLVLSKILKEGYKFLSLIEEINSYSLKLLFKDDAIDLFFKRINSAQERKKFISKAPVFTIKDKVNILCPFLGIRH